jgi:hypothetical protein
MCSAYSALEHGLVMIAGMSAADCAGISMVFQSRVIFLEDLLHYFFCFRIIGNQKFFCNYCQYIVLIINWLIKKNSSYFIWF